MGTDNDILRLDRRRRLANLPLIPWAAIQNQVHFHGRKGLQNQPELTESSRSIHYEGDPFTTALHSPTSVHLG